MYRTQRSHRNASSIAGLGFTVIIAGLVSGSTGNTEFIDFFRDSVEITPTVESYKIKDKISSSNSSWNQTKIVQSLTPIMDAFNSEMEDFWHQVENGDFEFFSDEIALAENILKLHPNALL